MKKDRQRTVFKNDFLFFKNLSDKFYFERFSKTLLAISTDMFYNTTRTAMPARRTKKFFMTQRRSKQ
ncbi:MAG: hypothetical protein LUD54_00965 [Oscillospiraceae bacterium]|nr:hypothetical protein [Oscillospiraceae bacterium]